MQVLGIDVGSTYIKTVLLKNKRIISTQLMETSYDPLTRCKEVIKKLNPDKVIATGYGRHLLKESFKDLGIEVITEIKAFSIGAKYLVPEVKTIIDIGGQDTKVIALNSKGKVIKFEMNDKCAAGTGRFLEVMIKALGYKLEEVNDYAYLSGELKVKINSMCTVFAESEVISMISKGVKREEILKAIHYAIAHRIAGMVKRVSTEDEIVFAGGCASNAILKNYLERELNKKLVIPEHHSFLGALGAALYGSL